MLISKTSQATGISRTRDLPVTQEMLDAWENGAMIQDVMPHLSDADREFIMTGITADEWDELFKEQE